MRSTAELCSVPNEVRFKPEISWRDYYITVYRSPLLPIHYFTTRIGSVRLTPYNLLGVIEFVKGEISRLIQEGYPVDPNSHIVFTDSLLNPVAHFSNDGFQIINERVSMSKIVILDPTEEINLGSVLSTITRGFPFQRQGFLDYRYPIYGYVTRRGEVIIGTQRARRRDELLGDECEYIYQPHLYNAIHDLQLEEEAARLEPDVMHLLATGTPISPELQRELCALIINGLRDRGLFFNEPL